MKKVLLLCALAMMAETGSLAQNGVQGGPFFFGGARQFDGQDVEKLVEQLRQMFDGSGLDLNLLGTPAVPGASGPRTYLGAQVGPVSPEVAHQLDLPQGFYQTIRGIEPGSPAERAGLQVFDIITQVDDQKIINAEQLVQLIAGRKPGETVTVKVLRKGKEEAIETELAETARPVPGAAPGNLQDMLRLFQQGFGLGAPPPAAPQGSGPDIIVEEDDQGNRSTRMQHSTRSSMVHTDQGQFRFTEENGSKSFKVTDPRGNVVFDGPVNTAEERSHVPVEYQEQLKRMDAGGMAPPLSPGPGQKVPPRLKKMPI